MTEYDAIHVSGVPRILDAFLRRHISLMDYEERQALDQLDGLNVRPISGDATALTVPWVVVPPESDAPDAGFTIWTRGLNPNQRIAWQGRFPDTEAIFHRIVDEHNRQLDAMADQPNTGDSCGETFVVDGVTRSRCGRPAGHKGLHKAHPVPDVDVTGLSGEEPTR